MATPLLTHAHSGPLGRAPKPREVGMPEAHSCVGRGWIQAPVCLTLKSVLLTTRFAANMCPEEGRRDSRSARDTARGWHTMSLVSANQERLGRTLGPRVDRTRVGRGPRNGCRPSLGEGWGPRRGPRGPAQHWVRELTNPYHLFVCLPSLPPFISLSSCLYFLPFHPLLGNISSEGSQSPCSPSRDSPNAR